MPYIELRQTDKNVPLAAVDDKSITLPAKGLNKKKQLIYNVSIPKKKC